MPGPVLLNINDWCKKVIFNNESIYQNGMLIKDNCRKLVVSMDDFPGADFKGIEQWNI